MDGGAGTVARRGHRHPGTWRFCVRTAAILVALGGLGAVAQLPLWSQAPALAVVNLATSLTFILTGLLLHREPGQRGVAWALILAGVCRPLDFIDAWTGGPWPAYAVVFGGIDRVFGAWAVLRYLRPRLPRPQRVYVAALAGWMLAARTTVVLTSTAQSNGYDPASWRPTVVPGARLSDVLSVIDNAGQGLLGLTLLVLLVLRLVRTSGLALKNAQLQAQAARAELSLVRASRARIVEAAVAERRRLERDLHDGAQQHLLGLAAGLANIADRVRALNGSTIIDSPPGNGTQIMVSIPCA